MKENILFFYKSSHGELHASLPMILKILSERENLPAYFIYEERAVFDKIPSFYKKIIQDNFQVIYINKRNFLSFYTQHFYSKNYIITCDSGHTFYSKILTYYWPFSRIAFFHHAYALLNTKFSESEVKKLVDVKDKYDGGHHQPLVISHNELEIDYRVKSGFNPENIIVAGNLGYQKNWRDRLKSNSDDLAILENLKNEYQKVIFIPTRDSHELYLSEKNSLYLINALKDIIASFPEYLFILKLHPRQKNIKHYKIIKENHINCVFTDLNTISVSTISDLVISFWSSSITDALAAQAPVVEFHRHDVCHLQVVKTKLGLVSLYHYMNLCPFYTKSEEIKNLLEDKKQWKIIQREQQLEYKKIFLKDYPGFVENLMHSFNNTPMIFNDYIKRSIEFPIKYILKKTKVL